MAPCGPAPSAARARPCVGRVRTPERRADVPCDHPTLRGIAAAEGNHMFNGQGAVPIFHQGVLIGSCGVGGRTAREDEDCVRAGGKLL
ncbi:MAG: heme-binding protein [Planctomycetota bacterium]